MRTRSLVVVASAALSLAPVSIARAGAAADAWTAAKANLPKDTTVLLGLDIGQLTASSLFSLAFPLMLANQPDVKDALDTIKSACKLDPLKVVRGVVIGTDDEQKHGAMFIGVDGLDAAKLTSCFEAVAKTKQKTPEAVKPEVKVDGKITTLSVGDKAIHLTWIGNNVIALPFDFSSKTDLQKWSTGGKALAKSGVAKGMAKVNTGGALWAVSAVPKDLDGQMKMKMGYGAITMASATLGADLHIQLGGAADAKAAATKAQGELTQLASSPGLAPNLKAIITGVTVTAAGDELVVKGVMPESDVLSLVTALMK